ncbi:MAG: hypothetical protein ACFFC1_13770 [Promethearchaeota archaeon]
MSLDSKWLEKLENFLILKGYTEREKGLIVYGGKNNGTVDLKATNSETGESIIVEIKNNPIHLIDLSHYLSLKRNIESHNTMKGKKLKFFLLSCEHDISPGIKKIAKNYGIIVENLNEFIKRESF